MWRRTINYMGSASQTMKIFLGLLAWLIVISSLHFHLNVEHGSRQIVKMGYMPVITNLAAPLLDAASEDGDGIRYKALKFSSFAEMAESLRNGEIDAAFIIAPLSIVLRQQGEDVKVVYIGNRHESTMVTRTNLNITSLHDLVGKTIAVPLRYSGHNISILTLIEEQRLTGQINVVEMNPPDMASALASGALDAYYVGEPFAVQTLKTGDAETLFHAEDVWDKFICNLVVVRNELIQERPELVQQMVTGAVRSGFWASEHQDEAIQIASKYWNQSVELLEYAFTMPHKRTLYDQYIPKESEMQDMANKMQHVGLLENVDISGLVEDRFARNVKIEPIADLSDILR